MESKVKISHTHLPLTGKEMKEKQKIANAFENQFWAHNVTHTPSLVRSQFFSLMEEVHEILARLRVATGTTYLPAVGNACNYLLQLTEKAKPTEEFKRELVHQGLKDAKGYFSNLSCEQIDNFISSHNEYVKNETEKKQRERKSKIAKLHEVWDKASSLMEEIFKRNQLEESLTDLFAENLQTHEPFIAEIADKINNLNSALLNLKDIKRKRIENETSNTEKKKKKKKKNKKKVAEQNSSPVAENKETKVEGNENSSSNEPKEQLSEEVKPSFSQTEQKSETTTQPNESNPQKPTEDSPSQQPAPESVQSEQESAQQQQEDENQKKIDENVIITVKKVGESVDKVKQELLNVDKIAEIDLLSHAPTLQDKEKLKQVRQSVLKAQETLMKHLMDLDQLVGSSEKVRPFRKAQVHEIQEALNQVDTIGNKLKKIETEIRHQEKELALKEETERKMKEEEELKLKQQQQQQKEEEEIKRKQHEEELKAKKLEEELKQKREQEKSFHKHHHLDKWNSDEEEDEEEGESSSQESEQSKQRRLKQEQENQENLQNKLQQQKLEHQKNHKTLNNFPLPSKEEWMALKYDPNFEINRVANKYQIQALIPNLSLDDLSVEEREDTLTISGVRLPSEKEEQVLVQKVINFLRVYPRVAQNWTTKDFIVAILKVGSGSFGQFAKTYELPFDYDRSQKISASYQRGILSVDVPRVVEKKKVSPPPSFGFPFGNPALFSGRNPNIYPGNLFW